PLAEARRETAGERDHALRVAVEQFHVDRRLAALQAVEKPRRGELDKVAVSARIGREQRQVIALAPHRSARTVVVDEIDLAADDRLDPVLRARLVQLDRSVHHAVVGEAERGLAELSSALGESVDLARPIEQRVLAVDVEMDAARFAHSPEILGRVAAPYRRSRRFLRALRTRPMSERLCLCESAPGVAVAVAVVPSVSTAGRAAGGATAGGWAGKRRTAFGPASAAWRCPAAD